MAILLFNLISKALGFDCYLETKPTSRVLSMAARAEFGGNSVLRFIECSLNQFTLLQDCAGFRNLLQNLNSGALKKRASGEEEKK